MPDTLKPCPFCGGEVSMSLTGQGVINWLFITRGNSKTKKNCSCRLFMESDRYFIDTADCEERREDAREALVDAWNRRAGHEPAGECAKHNRAERGSWCGEEGEKG